MSLFDGMRISFSGMAAERLRTNVISNNIANAQTTRGPDGLPFRRQQVVFQASQGAGSFDNALRQQMARGGRLGGVEVAAVIDDPNGLIVEHNPSHPDADANGNVYRPNVNTTLELVDMMSSLRAYEANSSAFQTSKKMAQSALEILR